MFKKSLLIVLIAIVSTVVLGACTTKAPAESSAAPPSPYFTLTAFPAAGEAIEQTVAHVAVAAQLADEAAAAEAAAAEAAAAEAAAVDEAAAEEVAVEDSSYGYDYSYDSSSSSVGGQTEDQCLVPVFLD
ncbi:MAG: hypothetical protein LBI64_06500 [Coriobacteriales bacterium]|nr:hypothetical protein [Coriobacteriales bacterium]